MTERAILVERWVGWVCPQKEASLWSQAFWEQGSDMGLAEGRKADRMFVGPPLGSWARVNTDRVRGNTGRVTDQELEGQQQKPCSSPGRIFLCPDDVRSSENTFCVGWGVCSYVHRATTETPTFACVDRHNHSPGAMSAAYAHFQDNL